jgi:hypothetical protein
VQKITDIILVKNVTDDTTPHSKYAVYNKFFIKTLIQIRKCKGHTAPKKSLGSQGDILGRTVLH